MLYFRFFDTFVSKAYSDKQLWLSTGTSAGVNRTAVLQTVENVSSHKFRLALGS